MDEDKNKKQDFTGAVPPPPPVNTNSASADDDLDLTVSIKGDDGSLQTLDLDNVPAPDVKIVKEDGEKDVKKEIDVKAFRKESEKTVLADTVSDSVLKDLQDKATKKEGPLPIVESNDEVEFDLSELKPIEAVKKEELKEKKLDKDAEEIVTVDSLRELKPENVLDKKSENDHAAILADKKVIDLDIELGDGLLDTDKIKEEEGIPKMGKLEKVALVNRVSDKAKSRVAPVQTLMRTETIHDRKKKGKKNVFTSKKSNGELQGKTLDAVEELRVMSFDEWYRLGDIAEERIMKIKEKIEVLGEKGVIEQIKGLNAWRASKIMQEYLTAGINALIKEKSLEDYFEGSAEKDSLKITLDEWFAINKLNSQLMI